MMEALMHTELPLVAIAVRLLAALALGGIIGFEREIKDKPAGLRTHMLIALGTALFGIIAEEMVLGYHAAGEGAIAVDPSRALQGIVIGIGFLGGGTIMVRESRIHGLTSGAAIWVVGGLGLACGLGDYLIAGVAAALALFVLVLVRLFERALDGGKGERRGEGAGT